VLEVAHDLDLLEDVGALLCGKLSKTMSATIISTVDAGAIIGEGKDHVWSGDERHNDAALWP
jgi:hypothetical protein